MVVPPYRPSGLLFGSVFHTQFFGQDALTQANALRCDLHEFVVVDEFQRLFQRQVDRRRKTQRLVRAGSTHIGHVLFLAHVDHDVLALRRLSDDHPLVHRHTGTHEQIAAVLRIKQTVAGRFARFVHHERTLRPLRNVAFIFLVSVEQAVHNAVSVGIGCYIAFIGLQSAGLCVADGSTLVTVVDFTKNFNSAGISALLAVLGTLLMAVWYIKKVPGAILLGILLTWGVGVLCELTGLYVPVPDAGYDTLMPKFEMTDFSALGKTFGECFNVDFSNIKIFDFITVIFAFLFVDLFDTLGTVIGIGAKANMLDEEGRLPNIRNTLLADAIATSAGALLGTSTTTTFVESSAGVEAGGRTGLTALTAGVLFLLAMFFAPIFTAIPSFATAPALILVGFLMFTNIVNLKFDPDDYVTAIPVYLCIIAMPLFYSISEGISIGIISYVVLHMICRRKGEKISPVMYVLAVLFVLKYIFL